MLLLQASPPTARAQRQSAHDLQAGFGGECRARGALGLREKRVSFGEKLSAAFCIGESNELGRPDLISSAFCFSTARTSKPPLQLQPRPAPRCGAGLRTGSPPRGGARAGAVNCGLRPQEVAEASFPSQRGGRKAEAGVGAGLRGRG